MRVFFFLLAGCALSVIACNKENQLYDKAYFDFDSLISVQENVLMKSGITISKIAAINGKRDSSFFVPDSLKLAHELDVFRQLDIINKPLYRNSYDVKDGVKDTRSNLLIRSYTTQSPSPVPYVKFYYQGSPRDIKKIETLFNEENALYNTSRRLILLFDDSSGSPRLSGYQLIGSQKMILSDSVSFSVNASFSPGKN
jgi:hypothetical protein